MKFNMVYISSVFLFIVKLHFISSTNMRNLAWRLPYMARQKLALMKDVDVLLNIFAKYRQEGNFSFSYFTSFVSGGTLPY